MEKFIEILDGAIMPILLIICGVVLAKSIGLFRILSPRKYFETLADSQKTDGTSPVKAMCTALAGTLGVGNIAGVATAISAGGAGAVMWMWIGAVVSMSVKYGEVVLAVRYRRLSKNDYYGGAMYTIRDGLSHVVGAKTAWGLGAVFALFCLANSLITGNIVQTNSAAAALDSVSPNLIGALLAAGVVIVGVSGISKISTFTFALIPPLSLMYVLLSVSVIVRNITLIPDVFADIINGAFSIKAAAGGAAGMGIREAVRFGITRGIFSNEAGCGTAPTAHASADVKSPHHQGCFGIFEVVIDTLVLCSMTAFVILIAEKKFGPSLSDGVPLTLEAFEKALGPNASKMIAVSVVLFAFATVLAQIYYGSVAIGYFTRSAYARRIYVVLAACAAYAGTAISPHHMWEAADLIVGVMTVANVAVLLLLRRQIAEESPFAKHRRTFSQK